MIHYWWLPLMIAVWTATALLSKKSSDGAVYAVVIVGLFSILAGTLWGIVSYKNPHVLTDSLIWDVGQTVIFTTVLILAGTAAKFGAMQWAGLLLALVGLLLLKLG